jgi:hypothetical protein
VHVPTLLPNSQVVTLAALPAMVTKLIDPPAVELINVQTGQRPWGVEWECAQVDGKTIINVCNYGHDPMPLRLMAKGTRVAAIDALTGEKVGPEVTLQPLEVRLLRID